jgi:phage baseplate assembly protein W
MKQDYYTLPLRFDIILDKKPHPKCALELSIAQHLHLILTTYYQESRFDHSFGSSIWERDFEMITDNKWIDNVKQSIMMAIIKNEPRLVGTVVQVEIDDHIEDYRILKKLNRKVRKRLWVKISGNLDSTSKPFTFDEYIHIAPLSID